ncbi:unnamed protein product [Phaeothamnion confervicola]
MTFLSMKSLLRHGRFSIHQFAAAAASGNGKLSAASVIRAEFGATKRSLTSVAEAGGRTKEEELADVLRTKLGATKAEVKDISGGCGSMFSLDVESPMFVGKSLVNQHRLVKDALKDDIANMHGLTLKTKVPPK